MTQKHKGPWGWALGVVAATVIGGALVSWDIAQTVGVFSAAVGLLAVILARAATKQADRIEKAADRSMRAAKRSANAVKELRSVVVDAREAIEELHELQRIELVQALAQNLADWRVATHAARAQPNLDIRTRDEHGRRFEERLAAMRSRFVPLPACEYLATTRADFLRAGTMGLAQEEGALREAHLEVVALISAPHGQPHGDERELRPGDDLWPLGAMTPRGPGQARASADMGGAGLDTPEA